MDCRGMLFLFMDRSRWDELHEFGTTRSNTRLAKRQPGSFAMTLAAMVQVPGQEKWLWSRSCLWSNVTMFAKIQHINWTAICKYPL